MRVPVEEITPGFFVVDESDDVDKVFVVVDLWGEVTVHLEASAPIQMETGDELALAPGYDPYLRDEHGRFISDD